MQNKSVNFSCSFIFYFHISHEYQDMIYTQFSISTIYNNWHLSQNEQAAAESVDGFVFNSHFMK